MKLQITRGDTAKYKFQCKDKNKQVITTKADKVYFTVKKKLDTTATFKKTIDDMTFDPDGTYHVVIEAKDTERLDAGLYLYDVEVTRDGVVSTISSGQIVLMGDVTDANDKR